MEDNSWFNDLDKQKAKELAYSRRLDVHRWSDHPEADALIDEIYEEHAFAGYKKVTRRNLKVVLLDLYVAWTEDPNLKIAYHRNANAYLAGSIYNELHISRKTVDIVDRLCEVGLVSHAKGFLDKKTGFGRLARMWPTEALSSMFEQARFTVFDIGNSPERVPIELRDSEKNKIEYQVDHGLAENIALLNRYNELLAKTHVSLPYAENRALRVNPEEGDGSGIVRITQSDKFVYRVFNRGSFELGGRFYGGWWQRCPSIMRNDILIDDQVTVEIDYSSLHPTLLYARIGVNYWRDFGHDPYAIGALSFEKDEGETRQLAKSAMLILLNIDKWDTLPAAFRNGAKTGTPQKKYTNEQVFELIDSITNLHQPISEYFCSDVGSNLQNTDSKITEKILGCFVERGWPILLVHDSYIVPDGLHEELELAMEAAFRDVCGEDYQFLSKFVDLTRDEVMNELYSRYTHAGARMTDIEQAQDLALYETVSPKRSKHHIRDWALFQEWRARNS